MNTLESYQRIRSTQFMTLLDCKPSKFARDIKKGLIPKPDGYDGVDNRAFWFQSTVLNFLANPTGIKTVHRATKLYLTRKGFRDSEVPKVPEVTKGTEAPSKPGNIKINKVKL